MNKSKTVSVIVPFYAGIEELKLCLQSLDKQSYSKELTEVIVVSDGSNESLEDIHDRYPSVRIVIRQHGGSYAARNAGIQESQGEILAFTDSDCIPHEDWLTTAVQCLVTKRDSHVQAIGGNVSFTFKNPKRPTSAELYDSVTFMQQEMLIAERKFGVTANLLTWRSLLDEVGRFDESLQSGGDGEWGNRVESAGYEIAYCNEAVVYHPARLTLRQIKKKWVRVLDGFVDIKRQQGKGARYTFERDRTSFLPLVRRLLSGVHADARLDSFSKKTKVFLVQLYMHYLCESHLAKNERQVR